MRHGPIGWLCSTAWKPDRKLNNEAARPIRGADHLKLASCTSPRACGGFITLRPVPLAPSKIGASVTFKAKDRVVTENRVCRLTGEKSEAGINYRLNKARHALLLGEARHYCLVCENRPPQAEVHRRGRDRKNAYVSGSIRMSANAERTLKPSRVLSVRRRPPPNYRPNCLTGFSLIELITVVAVIGILAALLLPALSRAKLKAQGITCMNNSKQLLLAWSMYADDSGGRLPLAYQSIGAKDPCWVGRTNAFTFTPEGGALWPYARSAKVFLCPGNQSTNLVTHGMNQYVGGIGDPQEYTIWPEIVYHKQQDFLAGPAQVFVFTDLREDTDLGPLFSVSFTLPDPQYASFRTIPASYHNRSGALSFADGHAEIHRWKDERTMAPMSYPNYGIEAPFSVDVAWVKDRATKLRY